MTARSISASGKLARVGKLFGRGAWVRFGFVRGALLAAVGIALAVAVTVFFLPPGQSIHQENGLLEDVSVCLWAASMITAFWASVRGLDSQARLLAFWSGWVALLAGLRELDMHILLNPVHLGTWGVRYRIDWWLNGEISPVLKLVWLTILFAAVAPFVYPLWKMRRHLIPRVLSGEPAVGLLGLSSVFLFMGVVMDDFLRPVHFQNPDLKQIIEETSELIGAVLYAAGAVIQWRRPVGASVCATHTA